MIKNNQTKRDVGSWANNSKKIIIAASTLIVVVIGITLALQPSKAEILRQQQELVRLEREKIELDERRHALEKQKQEEEAKRVAESLALELKKNEEIAKQQEEARIKEEARVKLETEHAKERETMAREWKEKERLASERRIRNAANGNDVDDNYEALLNRLDSNGLTSDQKSLIFDRDGKDKWFLAKGSVKDVGTFLGSKYITVRVNSENYCDIYPRNDFDIMNYRIGQSVSFVGQYTCRGTGIMTHHDVKNATEIK